LLNKAYPASAARSLGKTSFDDILQSLGDRGIADYLRNKGYTVYKPVNVSEKDLINYLLTKGYTVKTSELQGPHLTSEIVEINSGCESAHSGSRSLCAVGEM
jgi:hypothetical protein